MQCNNTFFIEEINNLAKKDKSLLIQMSEEMYHEQIDDLVKEVLTRKTVKIILLAGPSSSGKTTTSNLIAKMLKKHNKNGLIISLDDFFLNRENTPRLPNGNYDFENITALDLAYFNTFLNDLFEKEYAYMPKYNFVTGEREKDLKQIRIDDETILIIEGLHALNPSLLHIPQDKLFKVYICVLSNFNDNDKPLINYTQLRLMRRCIRDYYTRARSISYTIETWQEVLNGEKLYIDPYKNQADFFVDSTHMYEPLLYANYLKPLLNKSKQKDLFEMLNKCENLDKNIIPANSLLNEFIIK